MARQILRIIAAAAFGKAEKRSSRFGFVSPVFRSEKMSALKISWLSEQLRTMPCRLEGGERDYPVGCADGYVYCFRYSVNKELLTRKHINFFNSGGRNEK